MTGERGQAFTLEAVAATIVIVTSLVFALQVTAVTPLSASTSNQHIENQQQLLGDGLLSAAAENGTLKQSILYWDPDANGGEGAFHCATGEDGEYTGGLEDSCNPPVAGTPQPTPPTAFGAALAESFGPGVAVNVNVSYGGVPQRLQFLGQPTDNAVTATRTVVLYDDDRLVEENGDSGDRLEDLAADEFYVDNQDDSEDVYAVVEVEVVVWRI
ncbi:DUF7288 family protein [Natronomonas sp.]|uniref:DUF7288 family protein n=1 Tax=Natronomonas sp. TaxID=2184060 RepID=UPI002FC387AD